jgi:hypothetical protein
LLCRKPTQTRQLRIQFRQSAFRLLRQIQADEETFAGSHDWAISPSPAFATAETCRVAPSDAVLGYPLRRLPAKVGGIAIVQLQLDAMAIGIDRRRAQIQLVGNLAAVQSAT